MSNPADEFEGAIDRMETRLDRLSDHLDEIETSISERVLLDHVADDHSRFDLDPVTPEDVAVDAEPTLFVTEEQYEQWQDGLLSREDLGAFPEDRITTEQRHHGLIADLFTPRSRAIVLDTWFNFGTEPVTISEVADLSDQLTRQTVHQHREALEEYSIIVEDGMKGNATAYRLNARHPVVQCLQMLKNLGRFGRTNLLLEREFLVPGPNGEPIDEISRESDDTDEDEQA